jgi:phage repressor protein C with HTH and peptisase S24 domain
MSRLSDLLSTKAAELGISQTDLADRTGMLQQSISALFSGDVAAPRKWREIARELQIPEAVMRELMIEAGRESGKTTRLPRSIIPVTSEQLRRRKEDLSTIDEIFGPNARIDPTKLQQPTRLGKLLPVLGEAAGGTNGDFIFNGTILDYVACPPSLENVSGAYAAFVNGESMSPRYRPGETVFIHPGKPPRRGDDVIVQIHPDEEDAPPRGYIKEFVGWSGNKLTLRQYNPESQLSFERDEVVSIHPIVLAGKY